MYWSPMKKGRASCTNRNGRKCALSNLGKGRIGFVEERGAAMTNHRLLFGSYRRTTPTGEGTSENSSASKGHSSFHCGQGSRKVLDKKAGGRQKGEKAGVHGG